MSVFSSPNMNGLLQSAEKVWGKGAIYSDGLGLRRNNKSGSGTISENLGSLEGEEWYPSLIERELHEGLHGKGPP